MRILLIMLAACCGCATATERATESESPYPAAQSAGYETEDGTVVRYGDIGTGRGGAGDYSGRSVAR